MRLDIHSRNRLGITYEVLKVFAAHKVDVRAIDMVTHHIFVDVPEISDVLLSHIEPDLLRIPGIHLVEVTDMLPSERQRAQLHAVLSAIPEAVIAADLKGRIILANKEAVRLLSLQAKDLLVGGKLQNYFSKKNTTEFLNSGFDNIDREIRLGNEAYRVVTAPFGLPGINREITRGGILILQAINKLGGIVSALNRRWTGGFDTIIGTSAIMAQIKDRALRLAAIDAPLLINGEVGTGKELFARACHFHSQRAKRPFLTINCATLPESQAESELFGIEEGVLDDASRESRPGLFELADKGTVFLDEIGELSPYLQAKLMHLLQTGVLKRIGGNKEIHVDVRLISASRHDLPNLIKEERFRADLFYRLNVLSLRIPALRDRREDIPELSQAFAKNAVARLGCGSVKVSKDAMKLLGSAVWPGNVRELENVIFQSISLHDDPVLVADNILMETRLRQNVPRAQDSNIDTPVNYQMALDKFERDYFRQNKQFFTSTRQLAKKIGVSHTTVARKLKKYRLM